MRGDGADGAGAKYFRAITGRVGQQDQKLIAAETSDVLAYATRKREAKQVDLIVANDVSQPGAGFEVDTNVASFVTADGVQAFPLEAKGTLAARIVDFVADRLSEASSVTATSSSPAPASVPLPEPSTRS